MRIIVKLALSTALASATILAVAADTVALAEQKPVSDTAPFIAIAKDAQSIAKAGEYKKARDRLKELEKTWDDAEDQFRPNNQDGWRDADRKLDKTLDKLRDLKPDGQAVNDAFNALIAALEGLKKAK